MKSVDRFIKIPNLAPLGDAGVLNKILTDTQQLCLFKCMRTKYCEFIRYRKINKGCDLFNEFSARFLQNDTVTGTQLFVKQK